MRHRFVCLLCLLCFAIPGYSGDQSIKNFIDGAGEVIYGLAWPTATYKRTSFKGFYNQGEDRIARITLHGLSAFTDGPLWVNVDIVFRNGALHDIRWGNHNALLMPPGKTVEAMGEFIQEMADEYQRQQRLKAGSQSQARYALTAIYNESNITIAFQYHWNGDKWEEVTLKPNHYYWFSCPYQQGSLSSPSFAIRYDWTLNDGAYVGKSYNLSWLAGPKRDASYAKTYQFLKKGSYLEVFEK